MEKALFSVSCTTCRARLAVRNREAIGEILECPKCGSMVLITPPDGWVPEEKPHAPPAKIPVAEKSPSPSKNGDSSIGRGVPVARETVSEKPAVEPPPIRLPANVSAEIVAPPTSSEIAATLVVQEIATAEPAAATATASVTTATTAVVPATFTPFELPEVIVGETFLSSLTRSLWGRVAVLVVSGLLGLAGVLAAWTVVSNRRTDPKPTGEMANADADSPPADANAKPALPPAQFNRRWLPEQTMLLVDLRMSRLSQQPKAMNSLVFLGSWWQNSIQALLFSLHLRQEQVRHLTWAATDLDLADCDSRCVVVLELEEGIDAGKQLPDGENIDLGANRMGRRLRSGPWPHPLLAVDAHTIVSGSEEALKQLVARGGDATLAGAPMDLLLKKVSPGGDLAVMVDLSPARTAAGKFPTNLLDVWPAEKAGWHFLCETPTALGLSVQSADQQRCELGLFCNDETKAEKIRLEVEKLVPAALQALPAHIAALKGMLPPRFSAAVADQYKRLLDDLLAALRTVRCDSSDGIVWLHFGWGGPGFLVSAAATIESSPAIQADWLAAARAVDEGNHRGLLRGLLSYMKAQQPPRFPEGADGAVMFKPQTRLSWIAELLPYLGHADWHVESGYAWNNSHNQPVTKRPLPEVVNPAFGPARSSDYPVTHYVGVAGVGDDAAQLPANDARAGIFGYGRQTQQKDLARGGANTIAVLGVQDHCGPWAQGGPATVRPLTRQPYVNGPDGFGSGQADGMVAGMADGSVRFLSKNIDPHVMEQLATVRGGEQVDMAALEPKSPAANAPPPALPDIRPQPAANPNPPPVIDVKPKKVLDPELQVKLNLPIAKISLPNIPLADAVQLVSAMSTLPISFDPDAMEELGVSLHDPISIEVANSTAGKMLEAIAAKRNMASIAENGQIVLTSTDEHRESLRQAHYTVSDLTGGDAKAAADLAALVQRFVVPQSWQAGGGRGTVEVTPDVLRITQSGHVHYQIIVFCEKLRVARGLPTKSRLDPKKFALLTRFARARTILDQIANVHANAPASLGSILDQFKQPAGTEILIDHPALAAIGISENATGKFKADKLPQGEALQQLLEPLGLAWRAVDANTLQVTSKKAVATRMELEFYPVARLLAGQPPAALIERIKTELHGAVWGEGGDAGAYISTCPRNAWSSCNRNRCKWRWRLC